MQLALPVLINELAASPTRHVLVLDDYHVITDHGVHESLEFLISYLPPTTQLVIASRWDPPLPLARMRARGELLELRADDLRFSLDETAAMVSAVSDTELDTAAATALWQRTEGWAAGLQLAGLSLRGSPDPGAAAARVRGDDRHLFDYFTSEVLPVLAAEHRDLLVRAASLDLLSGPLCDAALQVQGSAAYWPSWNAPTCSSLRLTPNGSGIAVTACCGTRSFVDRTPRTRPRRAKCCCRAARWFAEHDRIDEAVRHLQRAGDDEGAAALLQAQDSWFFDRGWAATFLAHGERLAESAVEPQLALSMSYAAKISGRPDRIMHWLDVCDRQIDDDTVITGWRSARAAAVMMRGINGTPPDDPARGGGLVRAGGGAGGGGRDRRSIRSRWLRWAARTPSPGGSRMPYRSWPTRGGDADRAHWSRALDLQLAGLLAISLLQLGRGEAVDRLLVEAAPAAAAAEQQLGRCGGASGGAAPSGGRSSPLRAR